MLLLDMLLPTYVQMFGALSTWLTKAEAQRPGGEGDARLSARLAPDMFPHSIQVRFACRHVQEGVFRLQGRVFPRIAAGAALGRIDIQGSRIMAAARWTKPVK